MAKYAKKIGKVDALGGVEVDFASITGSPYDNTNLSDALDSKQDRINGVISGLVLTTGSFGGTADFDVKITEGTWYINPTQYNNIGDGDTIFLDQTYCSAGLLKYIDIVADTSSNLTIQISAESLIPVRYTPSVTEVIVGTLLVSDSVIEDNTPITSGLTEKFENLGAVSGTVYLDCESTNFPQFLIETGASGATLDIFNNGYVIEGTVFLLVTSTGTITFPLFSYYQGQSLTTKSFTTGSYSINFKQSFGNHYFDFNKGFTTADIPDSVNKRYVTDAQLVVIGNTSGTNTGDNATNTTSNAYSDAKVENNLTASTTVAPSKTAVNTALSGKQDTLSIASDAEMQTGTDNVKYTTAKRVTDWWTWIKTQSQTIAGLWTFADGITISGGRITFTNITTPSGDSWYRQAVNVIRGAINGTDRIELSTTGVRTLGTHTFTNTIFTNLAPTTQSIAAVQTTGELTANFVASTFYQLVHRLLTTVSNTTTESIILNPNLGAVLIPSSQMFIGSQWLYTVPFALQTTGTVRFLVRFGEASTPLTSRTILADTGAFTPALGSLTGGVLRVMFTVSALGASGVAVVICSIECTISGQSTRFSLPLRTTSGVITLVDNLLEIDVIFGTASVNDTINVEHANSIKIS